MLKCNTLERVSIAWNHAIEKDPLQINELEHVLVGKPLHTFPGHALVDRRPLRRRLFAQSLLSFPK
jgi:hypothetical protein